MQDGDCATGLRKFSACFRTGFCGKQDSVVGAAMPGFCVCSASSKWMWGRLGVGRREWGVGQPDGAPRCSETLLACVGCSPNFILRNVVITVRLLSFHKKHGEELA